MGICSVAVQFSFEIYVLALYFNPLRVEVNGVVVIFLTVCFITFIIVNLCYAKNKVDLKMVLMYKKETWTNCRHVFSSIHSQIG